MKLEKDNIRNKIQSYKKQINLNTNDYNAYYNLANSLYSNLQLEESIYYYNKCLKINPNFEKARNEINIAQKEKKDLIIYLTTNNTELQSSNLIIKCNQKLNKIKYKLDFKKNISENFIYTYTNNILSILDHELMDTEFNLTQIYRDGMKQYDCNRHFQVFNQYKVIPENCFECYKVLIQTDNVIELIKLFFLFNSINSKINLTRKCMIELRKYVDGKYKAFIYCVGLSEANETLNILNPILDKTVNKNISRFIKRGCSEFSLAYPDYGEINPSSKNFLKYNFDWKVKEDIIDKKISENRSNTPTKSNILNQISLSDALIIKNWIVYAKLIGDDSYKKFNYHNLKSEYLEKIIN